MKELSDEERAVERARQLFEKVGGPPPSPEALQRMHDEMTRQHTPEFLKAAEEAYRSFNGTGGMSRRPGSEFGTGFRFSPRRESPIVVNVIIRAAKSASNDDAPPPAPSKPN